LRRKAGEFIGLARLVTGASQALMAKLKKPLPKTTQLMC
jgi:hypothetical protein